MTTAHWVELSWYICSQHRRLWYSQWCRMMVYDTYSCNQQYNVSQKNQATILLVKLQTKVHI